MVVVEVINVVVGEPLVTPSLVGLAVSEATRIHARTRKLEV